MTSLDKKKVIIGLSGGVDSSVAALLLKEAGYEVIGVCLKLCQGDSEIEDAISVSKALNIPCEVYDFSEKFRNTVVDYFAHEYKVGRTPNPCNVCNKHIKWASFLEIADRCGAYYIATGHYARIEKTDGTFAVKKSDGVKDQTYALCLLNSSELSRTLMPLSNYSKDEVRKIASLNNLPTASKSDSMDICFVPDGDYTGFLDRECGIIGKKGNFVDADGNVLGTHKGIMHYTVGQRRGLGIAAKEPYYVIKIDADKNEVVLGTEMEAYSGECICDHVNWVITPTDNLEANVKIRYNHTGENAIISRITDSRVLIKFKNKVKGVAPGQMAVFYKDGILIGGGTII